MTDISIHDIVSVEIREPERFNKRGQTSEPFYARDLIAVDKNGEKHTVTLFAKDFQSLSGELKL